MKNEFGENLFAIGVMVSVFVGALYVLLFVAPTHPLQLPLSIVAGFLAFLLGGIMIWAFILFPILAKKGKITTHRPEDVL